jgi:hypothetical protein
VIVIAPQGPHRYNAGSDSWVPGTAVTYQGPLRQIGPLPVFNGAYLPTGNYTFNFGVDLNMNGVLDMKELFYDFVVVTVQ